MNPQRPVEATGLLFLTVRLHPQLDAVRWLLGEGLVHTDFCFSLFFLHCSKVEVLPVSPRQLGRSLMVQVNGCLQPGCLGLAVVKLQAWVSSGKMLHSGVGNRPASSKVGGKGEKALQAPEERFPCCPGQGSNGAGTVLQPLQGTRPE